MLQFLPYALAAYGGYKGYKASKDAGGSGLQRLLAGATGAFLGYQGGKMVPGVSTAGFGQPGGIPSFTQLGPIQSLANTGVGRLIGLPQQSTIGTLIIMNILWEMMRNGKWISYLMLKIQAWILALKQVQVQVHL